jgi:hypothetical protein
LALAFAVAALLIGFVPCSSLYAQQPSPNLLPNPGFEEVDATGAPVGWTVSVWGGAAKDGSQAKSGTAKLEVVDAARTGKKALKVRWIDGSVNVVAHPVEKVVLKGKEKFRLSYWFKGPKDVTVYASMLTSNDQNPQIDYQHAKAAKGSEEWQQVIFEFSNSPEANKLAVFLRVDGDGVLFDDVTLERLALP